MSYMNLLWKMRHMSNTEQLSRGLKWLCRAMQALALFSSLVLIAYGVFGDGIDRVIEGYWQQLADAPRSAVTYTPFKQLLIDIIAGLAFFSPLFVLFGIWHVFRAFARGPILSPATVSSLRVLGAMIITRVLFSLMTLPAMFLAFTFDNPEGQRVLSIAVGIPQLMELLYGVLLILIGYVLRRAVVIADEHGQFV